MELFDKNGCLTDEGLQALQAGGLDELGRLETAEHLSYCDKCMDRYTALLTADALETPPHSAHKAVMATMAEHEAKSTQFKKIHRSMRSFQHDQLLWDRFSEFRYASYMSAVRL